MGTLALVYYELAFGRSNNISNWAQEIKNRSTRTYHINLHPIREIEHIDDIGTKSYSIEWRTDEEIMEGGHLPDDKFYYYLTEAIAEIINVLLPQGPMEESLLTFVKRRHEWVVSGSAGRIKLIIPKASSLHDHKESEDKRIRADKRAVLESLTLDEIMEMLNTEPIEFAVASEKFENGKARAIYAVEIIHYIYNSFCTQSLEERFHCVDGFEKGLSGIKEYAGMQIRANITQKQQAECSMFDYADFNIQHTPKAQATIFEQLAIIGAERGYSEDWVHAENWVAKSKYNSVFCVPGNETIYSAKQGMFSGTRSTDLINSILNLAYFNVSKKLLQEEYGVEPLNLHHVHQGDDVWLSNDKRHFAALLFYQMNASGFRFQPSKQMFGRGYGEFLRVLYNPNGGLGYSVRSVINYFLKPLQNQQVLDVREQCQNLSDTYYTLQRRGMNVSFLNTLYEADLIYWACIRVNYHDSHPTRIPSWLIQLDVSCGGFGCPRPGTIVSTSIKIGDTPHIKLKKLRGPHLLKTHMTNDWISYVSEALPEGQRYINSNALFEVNYFKVLRTTKNGADMAIYKEDWKKWIEKHRIYGISEHTFNSEWFDWSFVTNIQDESVIVNHALDGRYHRVNIDNLMQIFHANINEPLKEPTRTIGSISPMLRRLFSNSYFKDIHTTATALDMNKHLALTWIIEFCTNDLIVSSAEVDIILQLLSKHQMDLFDWMLTQSFGVLSCCYDRSKPS